MGTKDFLDRALALLARGTARCFDALVLALMFCGGITGMLTGAVATWRLRFVEVLLAMGNCAVVRTTLGAGVC